MANSLFTTEGWIKAAFSSGMSVVPNMECTNYAQRSRKAIIKRRNDEVQTNFVVVTGNTNRDEMKQWIDDNIESRETSMFMAQLTGYYFFKYHEDALVFYLSLD